LLEVIVNLLLSDTGRELAREFGFEPVPASVQALNTAGLATVKYAPDTTPWIIETNTIIGGGAGEKVLSSKRQT